MCYCVCVCVTAGRGWMNSYPKKRSSWMGAAYIEKEKETRKPINITSPLGAISEKANRLRNLCSLLYRVYRLCKTTSIPNWYEWDQSHLPLLASHRNLLLFLFLSDTRLKKKKLNLNNKNNNNKKTCVALFLKKFLSSSNGQLRKCHLNESHPIIDN
jgi:hypothetical protein